MSMTNQLSLYPLARLLLLLRLFPGIELFFFQLRALSGSNTHSFIHTFPIDSSHLWISVWGQPPLGAFRFLTHKPVKLFTHMHIDCKMNTVATLCVRLEGKGSCWEFFFLKNNFLCKQEHINRLLMNTL